MVSDYNKTTDYSKIKLDSYQIRHRMRNPFEPVVSLDHGHKRMVVEIIQMDSQLNGYLIPPEERMRRMHSSIENGIGWRMDDTIDLTDERILNSLDLAGQTEPPWSTNTIRNIHRRISGGNDPENFRRTTEPILAPNGKEYTPCPHENIRNELASIFEWMESSPEDPITTAILMVHGFEGIRPFDDGNTVTASLLFHLYLRSCGLNNSLLCGLDSELCRDMVMYTDLAMHAERTGSYTALVRYSIEVIHNAYRTTITCMESLDMLKNKDENTRIISSKAKERGRFSLAEASSWVDLSEQSVRMKLDILVASGILRKEGKTRGLRYVYNDSGSDAYSEELDR